MMQNKKRHTTEWWCRSYLWEELDQEEILIPWLSWDTPPVLQDGFTVLE